MGLSGALQIIFAVVALEGMDGSLLQGCKAVDVPLVVRVVDTCSTCLGTDVFLESSVRKKLMGNIAAEERSNITFRQVSVTTYPQPVVNHAAGRELRI